MQKLIRTQRVIEVTALEPYKKRRKTKRVSPKVKRERQLYYKQHKTQIKKAAERWAKRHKTRIQKYQN